MALLLQYGGRNPVLSRELGDTVSRWTYHLLHALGSRDAVAIWTYADSVNELTGFTKDPQILDRLVLGLKPPEPSERIYTTPWFSRPIGFGQSPAAK
jgi:hypothetical protein